MTMKALRDIKQSTACNGKLLDQVISIANLKNDSALALALDCPSCTISEIRTGRSRLSANMIIKIYELTSLSVERIKDVLAGETLVDIGEVD